MYTSKSFCNNDVLVANQPGVTSPLGEITPYAQTFTKELGTYADSSKPNLTLFNFRSIDDTGAIKMDPLLVTQTIELLDFIWNIVLTTSGQLFQDEVLNQVITYGGTRGITNVEIGPVVQRGDRWAPNWVKFKSDKVTGENENTVWLAIDSFTSEYSEYEIVVIPPITPLDVFFQPGATVQARVNELTTTRIVEMLQEARGEHPETFQNADVYKYINPLNSQHTFLVPWPVLIYGPAGNNPDAIKDALVDYILANSSYTRADWTKIFPDIFKRTEFILVPHWHKYAIPNKTLGGAGVYSGLSNNAQAQALLTQVASSYDPAHITAHAATMGHPYRSLMVGTIGSAENRDQLFELIQVFDDYINVGTSSADFNRMDPITQNWVTMITNMLVVAETMNEFSTMPQGMMKMKRDGVLYVVKSYQNIQYLIAARSSIYALLNLDPSEGV